MAARDVRRLVAARLRLEAGLEADLSRKSSVWLVQEMRVRAQLLKATSSQTMAIDGPPTEDPAWTQRLARHYWRTSATIQPFQREQLKSAPARERKTLAEDLIIEWIRQVSLKKSSLIVNGTREIVRALIEDMVLEGLGVEEMARRIETVAPEVARYRSHAIARTETHSAASFASLSVAKEMEADSPFRWEKQWVAVLDDRTREDHAALNGSVVGLHDSWPIGVAYPGDPDGPPEQVVNCRCVEVNGLEGTL